MGRRVSVIKKKLRKWLLEPKSRDEANGYLAFLILVGLMLTLFIRAMTAVFAEGILSGIYAIFMMTIGVVIMAIALFVVLCALSFTIRIAVNLIINTCNYFKKGK